MRSPTFDELFSLLLAVQLSAGEWVRGAIHIQTVNRWHSRFKSRLVRFRGVASRYLIHDSGMAARAERSPLDDARAPAVRSGPARLSGRATEKTRTQPFLASPTPAGYPYLTL